MKADKIFISVLILIGLGLSAVIYFPRATGSGSRVEVRINGTAVTSYPLSSDRTETISCPDGGSNTLEIIDGAARMKEADCPDNVCVGMHRISKPGETIVCLPHKLVLEIVQTGQDAAVPDADPSVPDADSSGPDANSSGPDADLSRPDANFSGPNGDPPVPDAIPGR